MDTARMPPPDDPLRQVLRSPDLLPRDKAAKVAEMLRAGAGTGFAQTLYPDIWALCPLALRRGKEADPFLDLIKTASDRGHTELAAALGLVMRRRVVPRDPDGPAGRYLSRPRIELLKSRAAIWHVGRGAPDDLCQALRLHYAVRHPYWRAPCPAPRRRVLVLNRLPNLRDPEAQFVHNQSNLPHAYEETARTDGFVFDVFFMIGTDFRAALGQIEPPDVVYNNILGPEGLAQDGVSETITQIAAHFDVPLLNPPEQVLPFTRSGNFERIPETDHYVFPKTVRFPAGFDVAQALERIGAGFDWPVILRDPYSHMGQHARLATSAREARDALHALRDGGAYAIQYHDLPQARDGLYYRYRLFKIGDFVFSSRIHVAEGWNVHGAEHDALKASRPDLGLADLEHQFWEDPTSLVPPATWDALTALVRGTGADVMGCDFTLLPDGRALIFELNGSMHVPIKGRSAFEALCGYTPPAAAGPGPRT